MRGGGESAAMPREDRVGLRLRFGSWSGEVTIRRITYR